MNPIKMNRIIYYLVKFLLLIYIILLIIYIMDNEKKELDEKIMKNTENKTEAQYLEICDHFKKIVEEKDKEILKIKIEGLRIKKLISKFYGLSRAIDEYIDNFMPEANDDFVEKCINMIRTDCSDILFDKEERELGLNVDDELTQFTINILDNF